MKNLLIYILLTITTTLIYGQGNINQDSIKYINGKEDFLLLDQEVKTLIKTGPFAIEQRISTGISLSAILTEITIDGTLIDTTSAFADIGYQYGIEGRYYHSMKRLIKEGVQADNLSGQYIFASALRGNFARIEINVDTTVFDAGVGKRNIMRFGIGIQNRFEKSFYTDSRAEIQFSSTKFNNNFSLDFSNFTFRTVDRIGFVIGKGKKTKTVLYPEIRTYSNKSFSFRIHRNDFLSLSRDTRPTLSGNANTWTLRFQPEISGEQKFNNTSVSIYQELRAAIRFDNRNSEKLQGLPLLYSFEIGSRFYYKMKKNIRNGEDGNNFSGPYIFASIDNSNGVDLNSVTRHIGNLFVGWGYQQEINNEFYMGIAVGIPFRLYTIDDTNTRTTSFRKDFVDLTIGMIIK